METKTTRTELQEPTDASLICSTSAELLNATYEELMQRYNSINNNNNNNNTITPITSQKKVDGIDTIDVIGLKDKQELLK